MDVENRTCELVKSEIISINKTDGNLNKALIGVKKFVLLND